MSSKKNIKQNFFRHIKRVLDVVEKMGNNANHFRCIVLMGDRQEKQSYSFLHASQEDLKNLLLHAMRHSDTFLLACSEAFEQHYHELTAKDENNEQPENTENNEENPIPEA